LVWTSLVGWSDFNMWGYSKMIDVILVI
jgi:hypothetical protein